MRSLRFNLILLLLLPLVGRAQTPIQLPPAAAMQLQVQQPGVDEDSAVTATAVFDPPQARFGDKIYYRVQFNSPETTVDWPDRIPAPDELTFGAQARGQLTQFLGGTFRPLSGFTCEVTARRPGHFTVPGFNVDVAGQTVAVPPASLDVMEDATTPPGRQLLLRTGATNLYLGQPFRLQVILPASAANDIQTLSEIQINGDGLIPDKNSLRQSFAQMKVDGQPRIAFIYEITMTPIATGELKFSAQAFTGSPRSFNGTIVISGPGVIQGGTPAQVFLISDAAQVKVRPLPVDGQLPGFTGSIGTFEFYGPLLSTNSLHVGQPIHLQMVVHPMSELSRLAPPLAPYSRDWQIIPDEPAGLGFTLIPLSDDVQTTPEIPFSSFDPFSREYSDLSAPPIKVTVQGEKLPVQLPVTDEKQTAAPVKLSDLATTPGATAWSLKPLQLRGWLVALLLLPLLGFYALARWDRHRRYLEAHPEIVRRRRARRALRHEKRRWRAAIAAGDAAAFLQSAAEAMRVACAPHFPAHPRALVAGDVLSQLDPEDQAGPIGDTVRKIFSITDTRYASAPGAAVDALALESKVDAVLMRLEEKL